MGKKSAIDGKGVVDERGDEELDGNGPSRDEVAWKRNQGLFDS
jgi:hypothetical protein